MKNKTKSWKQLTSTPPFFPGLKWLQIFSASSVQRLGNAGCGQFIVNQLCCSVLLKGDFSHSSSASPWGPFCRRQSCMNFSSVRHSHGVPVRTRLLQLVFLTGSQILPANLILSTSPEVLKGACFPWGPCLLQATICSSVGSSGAAGRSLLHHGPLPVLQGQSCTPMFCTTRESRLQHL